MHSDGKAAKKSKSKTKDRKSRSKDGDDNEAEKDRDDSEIADDISQGSQGKSCIEH